METNENEITTTPCKVCGEPILLTAEFCSNCGFPNIIYPDSISKEVRDYEDNRIKMYKDLWESKIEDPKSPLLKGYLVMKQGETILDVFPIYKGKNIFGKSPNEKDGIFANRLAASCEELESEHFIIEPTDEGIIKVKLLSGKWGLRNKSNYVDEGEIESTESIYIGNLEFVFC